MNDGVFAPASLLRGRPESGALRQLAGQLRPIVIVLGAPHSGASLCSHVLSALGVDIADRAAPELADCAPDDAPGEWERPELIELHDRVLALFDRGGDTLLHDFAFPAAWWADPRVAEVRRDIAGFLDARIGTGRFGFKDPRTVRLLPVWEQIFADLKLAPKLVFCLRNPTQVARSLQVRDGIDPAIGEYRWFSYVTEFFSYKGDLEFCTIEYEDWFSDPCLNLAKMREFLDFAEHNGQPALDAAISTAVQSGIRHHNADRRDAGQHLVRSVYQLARRADTDSTAYEQIGQLISQFDRFQQLQLPLRRALETEARRAADLPRLQGTVERLQSQLDRAEAEAETCAEALRASADEVGSLHSALETARQVGRATMRALAADRGIAAPQAEPTGWSRTLKRLLGISDGR